MRVQNGQAVCHDQEADGDNQNAAHNFHSAEMALETTVKGQELVQTDTCQQERNTQAQRINCEKNNSLRYGFLSAGDCKYSGQNWTKTGRPAKRERQAEHQNSP